MQLVKPFVLKGKPESSPDIHCPLLSRTYEEFSKVHMGYNEAIRTEPK